VKETVNGTLCPAAIVTGSEIPLSANCELLLDAELTVTLAPDAVSWPLALALDPTVTLPKLSVLGVSASCPAAVPVPLNGTATMRLPTEL
jgi:hypothetical protein